MINRQLTDRQIDRCLGVCPDTVLVKVLHRKRTGRIYRDVQKEIY